MSSEPIKRQNATYRIAADLRAQIMSGSVAIGQRLAGEFELMSRYSVSRQTVREALRELSTQGLVESRRGPAGGAFVIAPDLDQLSGMITNAGAFISAGEKFAHSDVCVAIFEIEAACCRLAAIRRDANSLEKMRQAIVDGTNAPDEHRAFFDAYMSFNRAIWEASGNPPLAFVMQAFMHALRSNIGNKPNATDLKEYRTFLEGNHSAIFIAIEAGDAEGAVRALEDNLAFWLAHPESTSK
jgi:GntR family transcriptional regulator, transcriptional repressor for pyruvate dehydrogenase complex